MKAIVLKNGVILKVGDEVAKTVLIGLSEGVEIISTNPDPSNMPQSVIRCTEVVAICDEVDFLTAYKA